MKEQHSVQAASGAWRAGDQDIALMLSACSLVLGLLILNAPLPPSAAGWSALGCCLLSLSSLKFHHWPAALTFRMALLAVPGMVTGALILLYGSHVTVMFHVRQYATAEMAARIIALTALALSASSVAWFAAMRRPLGRVRQFRLPMETSVMRFWMYALLAVAAGALTASAIGPHVWTSAYTTESTDLFLKIGTTPAIAVIGVVGMYAMLLSGSVPRRYWRFFWPVALFTLVECMLLRGMRLEVFAVALAMYGGHLIKTATRIRPLLLASIMVVAYFSSQVVGVLRSIADSGMSIREGLAMAFRFAYEEGLDLYFQLGTFADIGATFYNVVGLVDDRIIKPFLGVAYLSYIPRTLPEFIYAGRPQDLALIFENYGITSGGGMFELAEAYINFGTIGCVIVPAAITYIIGKISRNAEARPGFTGMMLYLLVFSLFLRGIWYQTFAFYKTIVTWLVLEFLIWLSISFLADFILIEKSPAAGSPEPDPAEHPAIPVEVPADRRP